MYSQKNVLLCDEYLVQSYYINNIEEFFSIEHHCTHENQTLLYCSFKKINKLIKYNYCNILEKSVVKSFFVSILYADTVILLY